MLRARELFQDVLEVSPEQTYSRQFFIRFLCCNSTKWRHFIRSQINRNATNDCGTGNSKHILCHRDEVAIAMQATIAIDALIAIFVASSNFVSMEKLFKTTVECANKHVQHEAHLQFCCCLI